MGGGKGLHLSVRMERMIGAGIVARNWELSAAVGPYVITLRWGY